MSRQTPSLLPTNRLARKFARAFLGSPGGSGATPSRATPRNAGKFHQQRGVFLLLLAALVLWLNLTYLIPLIMGAIFAVVLYPLMNKMNGWNIGDTLKATIVSVGFTVLFLLPIAVMIFLGAEGAIEKLGGFQNMHFGQGDFSFGAVVDLLHLRPMIDKITELTPVTETQIAQFSTRSLITGGALVAKWLQDFLANIPGVLFANFVILITMFFLLIDGKRAVAFIRKNSFLGRNDTDKLIDVVASLCNSVIVATVVTGAVQAGLIGIACLITGTSGIVLIVLASFLASFFPVFGTAPVTIFLMAQSFLQGDTASGFIFLASIFIVGTSDNIVRPYVLKGGADMHPLIAFVAAFGALDMIGFYGLFIGPLVAGVFFALLPMVTRSYAKPAA